jgi:hypothetical protein
MRDSRAEDVSIAPPLTLDASPTSATAVAATVDASKEEARRQKSSWKPKNKAAVRDAESASQFVVVTARVGDQPGDALSFSGSYVGNKESSAESSESMDRLIDSIISYLRDADAPRPNSSTMPIYHGTADILFELDQTSKKITDTIINHQNNASEGTPMVFVDYNRTLAFHRRVAVAELQRHRRQFIKVNSTHPPATSQLIGEAYIDFLALQI